MKRSDRSVGTIQMDWQFKKCGENSNKDREKAQNAKKGNDVQEITKTPEGGR